MSTESDLIKDYSELLAGESPGALAEKEVSDGEARIKSEQSAQQAETAWRAANYQQPYDYTAAFSDGVDFSKGELPNKHFQRDSVEVAGHDLSTGERRRQVLRHDRGGALQYGVSGLQKSKTLPGKPAPQTDVAPLANVAYAFQADGKTFDEFSRSVSVMWNDDYKRHAWKAGGDALMSQRLERHIVSTQSPVVKVKPADFSFEETLANPQFSSDSRRIYRSYKGKDFSGNDQEASRWLAEHFRDLDLNSTMQAIIVTRLQGSDAKTLQAYGQALETWERTAMEKSLFWQLGNAGRVIADPSNLLGFGIGKATFVSAGRLAMRNVIKRLSAGAIAGAATGATGELARSQVAGQNPETARLALGAGGGAVASGLLSASLPEVAAAGGKLLDRVTWNVQHARPAPVPGARRAQFGMIDLSGRAPDEQPPFDPVTGFYSPARRAVETAGQEIFTPEQALALIKKAPDVRAEELEWLDLDTALAGKTKVTKAEMLEIIDANRPQMIDQTLRGQGISIEQEMRAIPEYAELADRRQMLNDQYLRLPAGEARTQAQRELSENLAREIEFLDDQLDQLMTSRFTPDDLDFGIGGAKHGEYTMGGYGAKVPLSYRESLLLHPGGSNIMGEELHYGDIPGIVATSRVTERELPGGIKANVIEEFQSDLHHARRTAEKNFEAMKVSKELPPEVKEKFKQFETYDAYTWSEYLKWRTDVEKHGSVLERRIAKGREGWADASMAHVRISPENLPQLYGKLDAPISSSDLPRKWEDVPQRQRRAMLSDQSFWAEHLALGPDSPTSPGEFSNLLPKEPLAKSWPISLVKSELYRAAAEGKDMVAWTPGEVQRKRWGKEEVKVSEIVVNEQGIKLETDQGQAVFPHNAAALKKLTPEMQKYIRDLTETAKRGDGKAMQEFAEGDQPVLKPLAFQMYDKEVVNEANKFLKRYNAKVEQVEGPEGQKLWAIKITPEMRKKILQGGVPLGAMMLGVQGAQNGDQRD